MGDLQRRHHGADEILAIHTSSQNKQSQDLVRLLLMQHGESCSFFYPAPHISHPPMPLSFVLREAESSLAMFIKVLRCVHEFYSRIWFCFLCPVVARSSRVMFAHTPGEPGREKYK
jgi:hypothetical protein